jgi:hypothetical protein
MAVVRMQTASEDKKRRNLLPVLQAEVTIARIPAGTTARIATDVCDPWQSDRRATVAWSTGATGLLVRNQTYGVVNRDSRPGRLKTAAQIRATGGAA